MEAELARKEELTRQEFDLESIAIPHTCNVCQVTHDCNIPRFIALRPNRQAIATCSECRRKSNEERARLEEESRKARQRLHFQGICPPAFWESVLERLPTESRPLAAQILQWQYSPKGLLLAGKTGKGKTRIAYMLIKRLVIDENRSAAVFDRFQWASVSGKGDQLNSWFRKMVSTDVLLIDDLGKCNFSAGFEAALFDVINARTEMKKPILITTNDSAESLVTRMSVDRGEPLIRRLREFLEVIIFPAPTHISAVVPGVGRTIDH